MLYLGDTESRIHRIDIETGVVAAAIDDDAVLPMALAADCERNRIWAISPEPRGRGLRAIAFGLATGRRERELKIPVRCFPASAIVTGDDLIVGGECLEGAIGDPYSSPEPASYYTGKRIGVRVSLTSGEARAGLPPFETSCSGAGACVGGSIDVAGQDLIASLPVASRIGMYSGNGELTRVIPIKSPAFVRDGSQLPGTASSTERVQWSTRNSLVHNAFAIANHIAVVHYLVRLPPGWRMDGQQRPQFTARMNVLTSSGDAVRVDIALPELPVGADHEAVYVVDYGPQGRQQAHETVTVLRVAVPGVMTPGTLASSVSCC